MLRRARGKAFRPAGGKFLRPDQDIEDDDDDDDDEDDDSEEEAKPKQPARKVSAKLSSSEDEDEEEEDDEEENEAQSKKRKASSSNAKQKKRSKASSFFDEEAEASEDDEEDEDEPYGTHHDPDDVVKKHYTEEDIRREQMEEAALEIMRQQDRRRAQAGGSFERTAEEMAEEIENRHRMQRRPMNRTAYLDQVDDETGRPEFSPAVAQQSLVPSVSDPSLWMVSCATGKEMEFVFQLMNKCSAFARQGRPLGVSAVVAAQSKGRIYIESFSEPAVMEAIQGVRGLLQYSMRLVPIGDMTTVMTVASKKKMGRCCCDCVAKRV
jgi:transcription elongation factor SPT5